MAASPTVKKGCWKKGWLKKGAEGARSGENAGSSKTGAKYIGANGATGPTGASEALSAMATRRPTRESRTTHIMVKRDLRIYLKEIDLLRKLVSKRTDRHIG